MEFLFFKNQAYRRVTLSVILYGLFISFSLQAATVPITKTYGTTLSVSSYAAGDILEIKGDSLQAGDWGVLRGLTTNYHLVVNTPNKQVPDDAFRFYTNLLSVSFPEVTSIGYSAFAFCSNLQSASFPKVTWIEMSALVCCKKLTSVSFPKATSIGRGAFNGCEALLSASFPEVTSIGDGAFFYCTGLTSVSFPKVTSIKETTFGSCEALLSVSFPEVTSIGEAAFASCTRLTSASFPKATLIEARAFAESPSLSSVSFPEVTSIGEDAFINCTGLTSVSFPKATLIVGWAFNSCTNLQSVSFPEVTLIGNAAFAYCTSLTFVSFPEVTLVGSFAFIGCTGLASVSIPKVTFIGGDAFSNCNNLTGIVLDYTPPTFEAFIYSGTLDPFVNDFALLLVVPDSTQYTPAILSEYPAGTEAFNKVVSTEFGSLINGVAILTPNRIPTLSGGYYQWKKNGVLIAGATGVTYQATSKGLYTLYYVRDYLSVMLMSVYVSDNPYDFYAAHNRYQECEYALQLSFMPLASNRTVEVRSEGTGAAYVFDIRSGKYFKDKLTYNLPAGDSTLTIPYGIDENVKDTSWVTFAYQASGGTVERTDTFTLYAMPKITLVKFNPVTAQFKGILDISITNGSYYMQRSLDNGQSWQLARDTVTGEALPFSQSQIANFLPGDSILFRQPDGCRYEILVVGKDGIYPRITRSVTIPPVTDAIMSVQPGTYFLWSTDNFTFTITPTGSNAGKALHVSTSRTLIPDSEGLSVVKNQDGSFTVTIRYVQEAVIVSIDFATGMESIIDDAAWSYADRIYIRSDQIGEASVYTISGALVQKIRTGTGETVSIPLSSGLYVVRLNDKTYKVMINRKQ